MSHRLIGILLFVLSVAALKNVEGQDATPYMPPAYNPATIKINYVRSWDAIKSDLDPNNFNSTSSSQHSRMATAYVDGLGRPLQTVMKQGAFDIWQGPAVDLVSPITYDEYGREIRKYLPYPSTEGNGNFKIDPFVQQKNFYDAQLSGQNESYYYSKTDFESSPLSRVTKTFAPGSSWVHEGRAVEAKFWFNTAADAVRIWNVTDNPGTFGSYSTSNTYQVGELYKNVAVDEHLKQVIEFRDKDGRTILKKVQLTSANDNGSGIGYNGWLSTYYLYDDLGNLRAVLQPKAVELISGSWSLTPDILNELVFRYEYDQRNRMILKKVPGAGEVRMVYDVRDRLVMSQDGNMWNNHQWLYTTYDDLNRPVITGLMTDNINYNNHSYHLQQAYSSTNYPNLSSYPTEELTRTFYDDYSWIPTYGYLISGSRNSTHDNYLYAASNSWPYPQAPVQSLQTKGMVTGARVKILGATSYLATVNIYDDKGRIIQTQRNNISGGLDITTTQFSFAGWPLKVVERQEKASDNLHVVCTTLEYDDLGRVWSIMKQVNSTINGQNIVRAQHVTTRSIYNKIGQLAHQGFDQEYNNWAGLELLSYEYNVRGWLTGINKGYMNSNDKMFTMELAYDRPSSVAAGANYIPLFNGNISGTTWKTKGDGVKRKYDFGYDNANRLSSADYLQNTSATSWERSTMDYSVMGQSTNDNKITYDANGNLFDMIQRGWKLGAPTAFIDALHYDYGVGNVKNKLLRVIDDYTDPNTKLGDFNDGNNGLNNDYDYDPNGNLKLDNNKGINNITYNHLNLPSQINITGKGSISYTYDALGNKLSKTVNENGQPAKTTLYMGSMIYEDNKLQFISHEDGRIRLTRDANNNPIGYVFDYFLKDHLGNVRMVLTEEQQADPYEQLTFEDLNATQQNAQWEDRNGNSINISSSRTPRPGNFGTQGTNGDYSMLVRKSTGAIGAGKLLKVMSGDRIHTYVEYYYTAINADNSPANGITSLIANLGGALSSSSQISGLLKGNNPAITNPLNSNSDLITILNSPANSNGGNSAPKAYLHVIFFDEQFKYDKDASFVFPVAYSPNAKSSIDKRFSNAIEAKKSGYVYVYFSNESNEMVYFDNFMLTHERGRILEETHYYPFGLIMAGISSKALGALENKRKFNGIEQNTDFDINTYDAFYRNSDPQIGRWWQIDPRPDMSESPYAMMGNNPMLRMDPLGDTAVVRWRSGFLGLGKRHEARHVKGQWIDAKTRAAVNTNSASNRATRLMNDYSALDGNDAFDKVTDKINAHAANVVLTAARTAETDPNAAFRKGAPELIVNLQKFKTLGPDYNEKGATVRLNSMQVMGHELGHVYDILNGKPSEHFNTTVSRNAFGAIITISKSEINAMYWENILRIQAGLPLRTHYTDGRFHTVDEAKINWIGDKPVSVEDTDGNVFPVKK